MPGGGIIAIMYSKKYIISLCFPKSFASRLPTPANSQYQGMLVSLGWPLLTAGHARAPRTEALPQGCLSGVPASFVCSWYGVSVEAPWAQTVGCPSKMK